MVYPATAREVQRRFWLSYREGGSVAAAAAAAGVSTRLGQLWHRQAGGMSPLALNEPSGRYLSLAEREEIALGRAAGRSMRAIAEALGRAPSTISRELRRNSGVNRPVTYRAVRAQAKADARARRPKLAKLAANSVLREVVQDWLEQRWSPQQISRRLVLDFPGQEEMRVSTETIYQSLFVQARGALRRDLTTKLRTGRAVRRARARTAAAAARGSGIPDKVMISERPAEAEDRAVPGHWEGDLIIGRDGGSAIGTLVERSTRFVVLLHLPERHGAGEVRDAMLAAAGRIPAHLLRSLTWDQGIEMARHREISTALDLDIYFCDPHSPWQRGSNENTNGLLRQYFPKSTDLSVHTAAHLDDIAAQLNGRPRQTLGYRTPAEALQALLSTPTENDTVATTT